MGSPRIAIAYCVHDDHWYLRDSIRSFAGAGDIHVFLSRVPWGGQQPGNWRQCLQVAKESGAEVHIGDWPEEALHRPHSIRWLRENGYGFTFIPDSDEVVEPMLLSGLLNLAYVDAAEVVRVSMDTYWRSPEYVIRPRERLQPILLLHAQRCEHQHIREYTGRRLITLGAEHGVLHHLSYCGPDERILRKVSTWGHKHEVEEQWLERVWFSWPADRLMRDLHCTHPAAYGSAERIHPPEVLSGAPDLSELPERSSFERPAWWPRVSIVIPVFGAFLDLAACLESLSRCEDLFDEVVLVDDASPDPVSSVFEPGERVKLLRNDENRGFGGSCNRGLAECSGNVIVFLNSDTVVPRSGLIRLIESLGAADVGAAGPLTNRAGYHQQITPTYTSGSTLDLFAEDFADRPAGDREVDMLVGFCLAVKKSVLDEVGAFDEQFYPGMFEDNDLSYRIRRAGHKLLVAGRSFIHHEGSKSINTVREHPTRMLMRNRTIFQRKWTFEKECGFASHLSGEGQEPIVFHEDRHPDRQLELAKRLADEADISLCMIVRNEERVLADCLKSAAPFFKQMIIVDTGSTDRTIEIAKEFGVEVHKITWPDSFAAARNKSLKYARGKWCFWMDADDTLPFASGMEIVQAAIHAPESIVGFVVPVQFVEDAGAGTRVDHVKLFRNLPGVKFEGRIHEQNIASLRSKGGEIARSGAVVLHSGYDTSNEGQAKKRERDYRLLELDLKDRPNHPFVLFNYGMTDHFTGEFERSTEWLRKSIAVADPQESHVRKAYVLLGNSFRAMRKLDEALAAYEEGLAAVGEDPELHFSAGMVLTDLGRYAEAKEHYLKMPLSIGDHFTSVDIGIFTFKREHNLGLVCSQLGDYSAAREWFLKALSHGQFFEPSAEYLFNSALEVRDIRTMREVIDFAQACTGPSETWARLEEKYHDTLSGSEACEAFLLRASERFRLAVGPRLVLARRLLNTGRDSEAVPHLYALVEQGCAEGAFFLGLQAAALQRPDDALRWMDEAHALNPDHEETKRQRDRLRELAGKLQ